MEKELFNALKMLLESYKADFKNITGSSLNDTEAVILAKKTINKYDKERSLSREKIQSHA